MYVAKLPSCIAALASARKRVQQHYKASGLPFTFDGRLVGDIGEALALELFDLVPCARRTKAVDALTRKGGRTVQIKATGLSTKGPAFSRGEGKAEFLVFFFVDFERGLASVIYNGPERPVRALLPKAIAGTKRVSLLKVKALDSQLASLQRLPLKRKR